jgi:hypothetical protein
MIIASVSSSGNEAWGRATRMSTTSHDNSVGVANTANNLVPPGSCAQIGIFIDYGISDYQWYTWRMTYYIAGEQ